MMSTRPDLVISRIASRCVARGVKCPFASRTHEARPKPMSPSLASAMMKSSGLYLPPRMLASFRSRLRTSKLLFVARAMSPRQAVFENPTENRRANPISAQARGNPSIATTDAVVEISRSDAAATACASVSACVDAPAFVKPVDETGCKCIACSVRARNLGGRRVHGGLGRHAAVLVKQRWRPSENAPRPTAQRPSPAPSSPHLHRRPDRSCRREPSPTLQCRRSHDR